MSDDPLDPVDEPASPTPPARKRKAGGGLTGESLGGMLAGFDQLVMRTLPPPHELVHKGSPVRGLTGEDGSELLLGFPDADDGQAEAAGDPSLAAESPGD